MSAELAPILQALADTPGAIAAWDVDEVKQPVLKVFDISAAPRAVASARVPQPERKDVNARLATDGHITAYFDADSGVVWRNGPDAFEVWTPTGTGIKATKEALFLGDGTPLDRSAVTAVVPFTDAEDVGRGVSLRVGDVEHIVAIHFKHLAAYRVDYEDGQAWQFIGWVSFVADRLAGWLGVPIVPGA